MIRGLFGDGSVYRTLHTGLNDDLANAQRIGGRIANAVNGNPAEAAQGGFQAALDTATGEPINLESELTQLVDTTLRYDAETRLLREAYARLRTAISANA